MRKCQILCQMRAQKRAQQAANFIYPEQLLLLTENNRFTNKTWLCVPIINKKSHASITKQKV